MNADIISRESPEEQELDKKRIELENLKNELAERELDLATLHRELRAFESDYLRIVGVRYAELDDLEARIAETRASRFPNDRGTQEQARTARARSARSAQEVTAEKDHRPRLRGTPSDGLKILYRQLARLHHPDLATDDAERTRRNELMAEINHAYRNGDEARLRFLFHEQADDGVLDPAGGIGASLVSIIRKIAQVEGRMREITAELTALHRSNLNVLREKVNGAQLAGRDLLAEMEADMRKRIAARRGILATLMAKG